jgi:hypothetical protein
LAIAVVFYVASDFANLATSGVDRGLFLYVHADRPPFAPYAKALEKLKQGWTSREGAPLHERGSRAASHLNAPEDKSHGGLHPDRSRDV